MAKAKHFYESERDESEKSLFVESNGWVNNFSLHRETTAAQQDPEWLIDKFIFCVLVGFQLNINILLSVQ